MPMGGFFFFFNENDTTLDKLQLKIFLLDYVHLFWKEPTITSKLILKFSNDFEQLLSLMILCGKSQKSTLCAIY